MASARFVALCATLLALIAVPGLAQKTESLPRLSPGEAGAADANQAQTASRPRTWEIIPSLGVAETYTDNVFLVQDAQKQSDWITQVIPAISVEGIGPRLRVNMRYAPEFLHYARDTREDDVFHRGNALVNAELAKQLLFLEAGGKIDQYNLSLQDPLTVSNVNDTGNRATVTTAYVTPYIERDFGTAFRGEARFTYSRLSTDDPRVLDNDSNRMNLRLASVPAQKAFSWDLAYRKETITYDQTRQEILSEVVTADARRLISSTVGLLGQIGYERYDSGIPGAQAEDPRWRVGFDWTPTPRTYLAATAGERFSENTYGFDFRHRTRLTTWSANYSEDITTYRTELFLPVSGDTAASLDQLFASQIPDPVARQKAVQQFIAQTGLPPSLGSPVNFFTDQLFVVKRGQASIALQGVRNTLVANVFTDTRNLLFADALQAVTGDFAQSNNIRQLGGGLAWNWRVTARNSWNMGAAFIRRDFLDTDRLDDLTIARLDLTRQFQPKVSGSLSYRLQDNKSNQPGFDYTENAATAALRVRF
jgi:uncharacterized protein (PEP-CTERM system associated)